MCFVLHTNLHLLQSHSKSSVLQIRHKIHCKCIRHHSNHHSLHLDAPMSNGCKWFILKLPCNWSQNCDQPSNQLLYVTRLESTIYYLSVMCNACVSVSPCAQFTFINYQTLTTLTILLELIITTRCAQFHSTFSETNYYLHNIFTVICFSRVYCVNIACIWSIKIRIEVREKPMICFHMIHFLRMNVNPNDTSISAALKILLHS